MSAVVLYLVASLPVNWL